MSDSIALPQGEQIQKYTLEQAHQAREELAEKGIQMLDDPDATNDDLREVARIQKATAAIGERISVLEDAQAARDEFASLREEAEKAAGITRGNITREFKAADGPRTAGHALIDSAEMKELNAKWQASGAFGGSGAVDIPTELLYKDAKWMAEYKAVLGTDDALTDVDTEYTPRVDRIPGVVEVLFDTNNISTLFPNVPHNTETVEFMVESIASEGAVEVAEGALIPEAEISFAPSSVPVRKIGVSLPVTIEGLAQEAFMRGHVTGRLRQFLDNREDLQLLKGDGTGQNLTGIMVVAGTQTENVSLGGTPTGQDWAEAIHRGATKVRQSFLNPNMVLASADGWQTLRLAKDLDGQYLNSVMTEAGIMRVWGLPLMLNENVDDITGAVATDEPFAVVSRDAAGIHRRQGVSVTFTDSHGDRFLRDIITFKATERLALAVYRPAGICKITAVA